MTERDPMTDTAPPSSAIDRRQLLKVGAAGATTLIALGRSPLVRPAFAQVRSDLPSLTHGVQSGDVTARSAVVWG